jgi:hypothetical protein
LCTDIAVVFVGACGINVVVVVAFIIGVYGVDGVVVCIVTLVDAVTMCADIAAVVVAVICGRAIDNDERGVIAAAASLLPPSTVPLSPPPVTVYLSSALSLSLPQEPALEAAFSLFSPESRATGRRAISSCLATCCTRDRCQKLGIALRSDAFEWCGWCALPRR